MDFLFFFNRSSVVSIKFITQLLPSHSSLRVLFLVFFFQFFIFLNFQELFHYIFFHSQLYDSYIFTSVPKHELSFTISNISFCICEIISSSDSMFLLLNLSKFDLIYFSKFFRPFDFIPPIDISANLSLASFSPPP